LFECVEDVVGAPGDLARRGERGALDAGAFPDGAVELPVRARGPAGGLLGGLLGLALAGLDARMEKRTATTGCGQGTVFGDLMEDIDAIRLREDVRLEEQTLFALLNAVRVHESIYKEAGAVHGCALAAGSEILTFIEDVGRHNAVDAIAGWMWLEGIDGSDKIFYTTGRLTSEMVIKAAQMGIPFLVSRSGLTKMGHEIAERVGITMIGRAVNKRYLLFTGAKRFVKSPASAHA